MQIAKKRNFLNKNQQYTRLEYISNSGNVYFKTPVICKKEYEIYLKWWWPTCTASTDLFYGYSKNDNPDGWHFASYNSALTISIGFCNATQARANFTGGINAEWGCLPSNDAVLEFWWVPNTTTINVNKNGSFFKSQTVTNDSATRTDMLDYPYIFAGNIAGSPIYVKKDGCRFYEYYVSEDGIELTHLIPVIDPKGIICIYDIVSQSYIYNSGTGNFVAGPVLNKNLRDFYSSLLQFAVPSENEYKEAA